MLGAQSPGRQTWHKRGTSQGVRQRRIELGMAVCQWGGYGRGGGVSLRSRSCCQGRVSCVGVHLCPGPQGAGGWWPPGEGVAHRPANGRAATISMSELLRAVRDCNIDFCAQLFSPVLARAFSQCCRSCASALTPFPQLACANAELHAGITPKAAASGEAELHISQLGKGVMALLPAFFHLLVMD